MPQFGCTNAERQSASLFLCISVVLLLTFLLSCSHPNSTASAPSPSMPETKTDVQIEHSWHGDYAADRLAALPEHAQHPGTGYIGDPQTFAAVWVAFKPGEPAPVIDFEENMVIFVRNTQYYNRLSIGKILLENGIVEVLAMETLSARPIEDVVALSMAEISRAGVTGIRTRNGVVRVEGGR